MREAAFPIIGTMAILVIVLPAFALLAKMLLECVERLGKGQLLGNLELRFAILAGSTLIPVAWLISAGLHQSELGGITTACLLDHDNPSLCFEPALFVLSTGLTLTYFAAFARRTRRYRTRRVEKGIDEQAARIERIVNSVTPLKCLVGRITISNEDDLAIEARGWFRPRVVVGCEFAACLSDQMLTSALCHELEHVHRLDPLRYAALGLVLAANPLGSLFIRRHVFRWIAGREAACDRRAVVNGCPPLSLAQAIVVAARSPKSRYSVGLGTSDASVLKFRVGMLVAFSEEAPATANSGTAFSLPVALVFVVVAGILPHFASTSALDTIHSLSEVTADQALNWITGLL